MNKPAKLSLFDNFFHSQTSSSIVLLLAAVLALFWANSPWAAIYHALAHLDIGTHFHGRQYHLSLDHWVKDGLMTVFFFVVGLEIKREILIGELSSFRKAILPVMAALGGSLLPAAIYYACNPTGPQAGGWAVPMATDIAFSLGVLSLFGKRVPIGLKVFLTALAIVDDLLGVLVIAIFYTERISFPMLGLALLLLVLLAYVIRARTRLTWLHLLLMLLIWLCVFLSGVHATIAGVLVALTIPVIPSMATQDFFETLEKQIEKLRRAEISRRSLVAEKKQRDILVKMYRTTTEMLPAGIHLEDKLHSIQAFLILPLFALFSTGVTIDRAMAAAFPGSVGIGVFLGLVAGKQAGIFLLSWLTIQCRLAQMPAEVNWRQLWGASILGGIGFTMSIFISELAFQDPALLTDAKLAIFLASLFAAIFGYAVLNRSLPAIALDEEENDAEEMEAPAAAMTQLTTSAPSSSIPH